MESPVNLAASSALASRELVLARLIDAPRERIWHAWTHQLAHWWGPHGMTTTVTAMELRPGGAFCTVMRAPDGMEYPTRGIFLEVRAPERIVFTDAFRPEWLPDPEPFFTAVTTFEAVGGKTNYTARALHWTVANRVAHERMGFHHGWSESLDRLVALVTTP